MKLYVLPLFVLLLLISSCGGSKSALKESDLKTETLKAIVKNYDQYKPSFKTMRGRLKGAYDDRISQQSINISYRFQKDETLWMSARLAGLFEVAKIMITPDNIKFYERVDNSYFDGNFKLISDFIGLELNYSQIENLLLGQAIKPVLIGQTDFETFEGYYQLNTTYKEGVLQTLILDAKTFKIKEQILIKDNNQVKIIYSDYQMVENNAFPEELTILATDGEDVTNISLTYKNIKLNDELNFPFRMPSNFSPLQLN